jgi:DNA-directed RNA polymerase delta subunit
MSVLVENLGMVEAERFIMLMRKEPFDYTQWQEHLWEDKSVEEIHDATARFYRKIETST